MDTDVQTLEKLQGLAKLYRQGFHSEVVDQAIDKLLSVERDKALQDQRELRARLSAYEAQYEMSSEVFYQRFRDGKLGDDIDFVQWSVFYEMAQALEERLDVLDSVA